ncbi:ring-cleaving dioxygenase [Hymenobacter sp. UV11]|uniref:ring-cleaving dioxygenase n=1 Tax=Hymenobacter sp. UV11 TaxID=1849735 RepID=UPI0010602D34|nr:ring-cleaving dioxygenase [Hymenobacter sp. UV11]TDN36774.1 diguanylate cyclase [Hymenobacter sp. UV11]TFZ63693.1 ring-cleaving dioxygenase [Hymenobacter sp. UV11]
MEPRILGLHHVTAIAGNAPRNYDFYTRVLGLRFVKKTVNFDDPGTYHFYFGDETGSAGTILTFFPWEHITAGRRGTGQATEIGYSVPAGSFDFWMQRFEANGVTYNKPSEKFGEQYLTFLDPDGLKFELIASKMPDPRTPWTTSEVGATVATRGFHTVTLTLADPQATAEILTDVFGYTLLETHVNRSRYVTDTVPGGAQYIDLVAAPGEARAITAGGSVHHIAFRVKDDEAELYFRRKLIAKGMQPTPQIDRDYFHSVYFREPGGVLFELATENPGFAVDEPLAELGTHLMLPTQHKHLRPQLEQRLPKIG